MSIVHSTSQVNISDSQGYINILPPRKEAAIKKTWAKAEGFLLKAVCPYLNARRNQVPVTLKGKLQAIYAGRLIKQYNETLLRALDLEQSSGCIAGNSHLWKLKRLFSQQIYPEPCVDLESSWSTWTFKGIMNRHEFLCDDCGVLKMRIKYYQFAQQMLCRFLDGYPQLNSDVYLPSLRMTALLLSLKVWCEYNLTPSELYNRLPIQYMYLNNRTNIPLIVRMQNAFLRVLHFDLRIVSFANQR